MDNSLVYLRDNPTALALLLLVGNLLSLMDLTLTRICLDLGGTEVNLLARHLLVDHPAFATIAKVGSVAVMSSVIWRLRRRRRIVGLAVYLVCFYSILVFYELAGIVLQ